MRSIRILLTFLALAITPGLAQAAVNETEGPLPREPIGTCATICAESCDNSCQQYNAATGLRETLSCAQYLSRSGVDNDGDGRIWSADNCACASNATQADCDGDGIGTACDGLNGNYRADSARYNVPCYVRKAQHLGYFDVEITWETRYLDSSTCRSPALWDKRKVRNRVFSYNTSGNGFEDTCKRMLPYNYWILCYPPNLETNFCQNNGDTWPY